MAASPHRPIWGRAPLPTEGSQVDQKLPRKLRWSRSGELEPIARRSPFVCSEQGCRATRGNRRAPCIATGRANSAAPCGPPQSPGTAFLATCCSHLAQRTGRCALTEQPLKILRGLGQPLLKRNRWFPRELLRRERDVRLPLRRVVAGKRESHDRGFRAGKRDDALRQ